MRTREEKKWRRKGSRSSLVASRDFKPGKKRWASALLSDKCCCFVRKPASRKRRKFELARLKKKKKKEKHFWPSGDSGLVPSRCFFAPLGVFFVMKTIEDER